MADKTYLYQPTGITKGAIEVLVNTGATTLAVAVPSGTSILPVTIDEAYKTDLDEAMADHDYAFVGEATDPDPGTTTNWGSQPNEPTGPTPFGAGDTYYNTTNQSWYFWDADAMEWKPYGSNTGPGSAGMVITLTHQDDAWADTNSNVYTGLARFRFAGTNKLGTAISIFVNAWKSGGPIASWVDIRILDLTNAVVIAELTNIDQGVAANVNAYQLLTLGPLGPLPPTQALWEVQGRRANIPGPAATCAISTVNVEF